MKLRFIFGRKAIEMSQARRKNMKNDENHRFSLILILLTYPLRFSWFAFSGISIKFKNNEKHRKSSFLMIFHDFAYFGKFIAIRN